MSTSPAPMVLKVYPFGYGSPNEVPPTAPRGAYYDVASRQVLRDTSGVFFMQMHPVDQAVGFICGMQIGSIKSAPTLGVDYSGIDGQPQSKWQKIIDSAVRNALSLYITRNDITLQPVQLINSVLGTPWSLEWIADYVNNRLPATQRGTRQTVTGRY